MLSKSVSNRRTFFILDILNKVFNEIKWSNNPKIYLELAFIKITDNELSGESSLISQMDDLEKRVLEIEKVKDNLNAITEAASDLKIKEIINEEAKEESEEEIDVLENLEIDNEEDVFNPAIDEIQEIEKKLCDDLDNTYSIAFVEKVLNNANKDDKNKLINQWNRLRRSATTNEEKHIAEIMEVGKIVASSVDSIIISFPSATICNQLMTPSSKVIAKDLLKNLYSREMDFIALPEDVFEDITKEFIELWKKGNKYIKLSKITCEGLKDVSEVMAPTEEELQPKVVTDAINLFGDLVVVKQ